METRSRTRLLRRASLAVVALGALVVPATADAATNAGLNTPYGDAFPGGAVRWNPG